MAEQNNFAISEFINNKKAESNYEPIKNKVNTGEIIMIIAMAKRQMAIAKPSYFGHNVNAGVEAAMGVQQDAD